MTTNIHQESSDIAGAIFILCATALIILFAGEPDLLDGMISYLMRK